MYQENQGRNKRRHNNKRHRAVPTRTVCDEEAEPRAKNSQVEYGEELALDDLLDITLDDSCID